MAFFKKKEQERQPDPIPRISMADLQAAELIMARWEKSLGNSDATWDCLEAIGHRGGYRGALEVTKEVARGVNAHTVTQRPWRWWLEAAVQGCETGRNVLSAQIFLFTWLYVTQMIDSMQIGNIMDTGLDRPDSDVYTGIAQCALRSLGELPPELIIHDSSTGKVDVLNAFRLAAEVARVPSEHPQARLDGSDTEEKDSPFNRL